MKVKSACRLLALGVVTMLVTGAHAQNEVLVFDSDSYIQNVGGFNTFYTKFSFDSSMILNSVGFVASPGSGYNVKYILDGITNEVSVDSLTAADAFGMRYFNLAQPTSVNETSVLQIFNADSFGRAGAVAFGGNFNIETNLAVSDVFFEGVRSTHVNQINNIDYTQTTGNIKVSNPGSNVAPEPGTFALALTGGGALLGICIRRRRSAA
jgi:hypothetical protein